MNLVNQNILTQTIIPLIVAQKDGSHFFEFHINGQIASIEYAMLSNKTMRLIQVSQCEHAIMEALMERVLDYAIKNDYLVVPESKKVQDFIDRNTRYKRLLGSNASLENAS